MTKLSTLRVTVRHAATVPLPRDKSVGKKKNKKKGKIDALPNAILSKDVHIAGLEFVADFLDAELSDQVWAVLRTMRTKGGLVFRLPCVSTATPYLNELVALPSPLLKVLGPVLTKLCDVSSLVLGGNLLATCVTVEAFQPSQGHKPKSYRHDRFPDQTIACLHVGGPCVVEVSSSSSLAASPSSSSSSSASLSPAAASASPAQTPSQSVYVPAGHLLLWNGSELQHSIAARSRDLVQGETVKRGLFYRLTFASPTTGPPARKWKTAKTKHVAEAVHVDELRAAELEDKHVRQVYDAIATHFSATRYKAWPKVEEFVLSLPKGSTLGDIGCGNGKYMGVNPNITVTGCDISQELVKICRSRGFQVVVADALNVPFNDACFDNCISIAVLHHISTVPRRLKVMSELLRLTKAGGRILLCAWAKEQDVDSRRRFDDPDVWVPWNLPARFQNDVAEDATSPNHELSATATADRDEPARDVSNAGAGGGKVKAVKVEPLGNDKDKATPAPDTVLQRYCHVYEKGELEALWMTFKGIRVVESYYDASNWCVVVEKSR